MKKEKLKKLFSGRAAKSVMVFVAVVLIGVAVYVNYRLFYDPTDNIGFGDSNMSGSFDDSQNTGADAEGEENYFTLTALNRQQSRDEAIDVLKLVAESEEASAEAKADAGEKLSQIALDIQNEANIETLVKAKGFEECVAVISDGAVSVIVSGESLQAAEAAQILAIVYGATGISPENVSIIGK